MSKPDDISQVAWNTVTGILGHPGILVSAGCYERIATQSARAIMSAEKRGQAAIAEMADAYADVEDVSAIHAATDESNHFHRTAETTLRAFATAIRSRVES